MKKWKISLILGVILTILGVVNFHQGQLSAEIVALKHPGHIQISPKDCANLVKNLNKTRHVGEGKDVPGDPWYLLKITDKKGIRCYSFTEARSLFDMEKNTQIELPQKTVDVLDEYLEGIKKKSPFGILIPWDEVDIIFPRMAKGKIRDLETGLTFNIQRRGGNLHADVQPLTAQDTKTFKEIYGNRWSWRRRAVILEIGHKKIAASMNGMPHGQGAIYGNNFPGHFCLHFYKSHTHSKNLDLAHQLMVLKAAGQLENHLYVKTAPEMVDIALTALRENDHQLVILSYVINQEIAYTLEYMKKVAGLKIHSIKEVEVDKKYLVDLEWYCVDNGNNYREIIELFIERSPHGFLVRPEGLRGIYKKS